MVAEVVSYLERTEQSKLATVRSARGALAVLAADSSLRPRRRSSGRTGREHRRGVFGGAPVSFRQPIAPRFFG